MTGFIQIHFSYIHQQVNSAQLSFGTNELNTTDLLMSKSFNAALSKHILRCVL